MLSFMLNQYFFRKSTPRNEKSLKDRIQILYMCDVESLLESFMHTVIIKSAEFDQFEASACALCICIRFLQ